MFRVFAWYKMVEFRSKLTEIRSRPLTRPKLGSNACVGDRLRPNLCKIVQKSGQDCSKLSENCHFEIDFRCFSRLQCVRDRTRGAKGRTFVFAGRRSTFKGSQTWWINPKSTPSRVRERKNRVFLARRVREASSERFFVDFLRFLVFL